MPANSREVRGRTATIVESLIPPLNAEYELLQRVRDRGTEKAPQLSQATAKVAP
jgi:hypothetical protein